MDEFPRWLNNLVAHGYLSTSFFFLLSGFILAYLYWTPAGGLSTTRQRFWWQRFTRIYPVHLIALIITFLIMVLPRLAMDPDAPSVPLVVASGLATATLTQSWFPPLVPVWSWPTWALSAVVFWTMGSLTKATWPKLGVTSLVIAVTLPLFARSSWALTALRLGDDKAASFGINVSRLRLQTLVLISLLAAFPVAFVGTIGFVGLVGPHIARMLIGEDQRFFLPASVMTGALLLSISSVVSKTLIPGAIFPVGVVTSLIGVPFFISLILSGRGRSW